MTGKAKNNDVQGSALNAALERLGVLAGDWSAEVSSMSFMADPTASTRGRYSFELLEGGKFLIQRTDPPDTVFPRGTAIIGPDDTAGTYCMLYFNSRGVSRIYQMSLADGVWRLWRDYPGFSQRFTGTLGQGGNTITASWEKSTDGMEWEHDFDLTLRKLE